MSFFRPNPNSIFTPRSHNVNNEMYVDRPNLQERLQRAVNGSQHIAVFGDSGCGKTWLYQKYLQSKKIPYRVVDLSVAAGRGLDHAFREALTDGHGWTPTSKAISDTGGADAGIKITRTREEQYSFFDQPPFDKLVSEMAEKGRSHKFLVFDNLEQVSSDGLVIKDLARHVIRLDNPRFALSGVRFLIVGVVSDMKQLVSRYDQAGTVANRLVEIPEVSRLEESQAVALIERGFEKLKISFDRKDVRIADMVSITDGNAQQIHALCYQLACEAEKNNWRVSQNQWDQGCTYWIEENLAQHTAQVEARLNKNETKVQRRNQVLYTISNWPRREFSPNDVERSLREHFPHSTQADRLGCDQILKSLADNPNPLLSRDPTSNSYRFCHPKLKIAAKTLLSVNNLGDVERLRPLA